MEWKKADPWHTWVTTPQFRKESKYMKQILLINVVEKKEQIINKKQIENNYHGN